MKKAPVKKAQMKKAQMKKAQTNKAQTNKAKMKARTEAQVEAQVEAQMEAQMEAQVEARMEAQVEAQVEAQADAKMNAQTEAQMEARMEAQTEAQSEARMKSPNAQPTMTQDRIATMETLVSYTELTLQMIIRSWRATTRLDTALQNRRLDDGPIDSRLDEEHLYDMGDLALFECEMRDFVASKEARKTLVRLALLFYKFNNMRPCPGSPGSPGSPISCSERHTAYT